MLIKLFKNCVARRVRWHERLVDSRATHWLTFERWMYICREERGRKVLARESQYLASNFCLTFGLVIIVGEMATLLEWNLKSFQPFYLFPLLF